MYLYTIYYQGHACSILFHYHLQCIVPCTGILKGLLLNAMKQKLQIKPGPSMFRCYLNIINNVLEKNTLEFTVLRINDLSLWIRAFRCLFLFLFFQWCQLSTYHQQKYPNRKRQPELRKEHNYGERHFQVQNTYYR